MPNNRPLLTIAIPTYNRRDCLAELLETLTPQLANESRVELIISDNASPDDTPALIESFKEQGVAITYSRNEANIGPDNNFLKCFELANGEYVWIFGDDDIIVAGGLVQVLRCLETRNFDLIYVTPVGFQGQYRPAPNSKLSSDIRAFNRPLDFALNVHTGLTFISGNIVRKSALDPSSFANFHKQVGTGLIQLSWTLSVLRNNARCACLTGGLVAARAGNSGGHGTCQVFGNALRSVVLDFLGSENPISRAILNRVVQSWFPWAMMERRRAKSLQHFQEDPEAILGAIYRQNPRYWMFLYPVLHLPLPLAELWLIGVKVVNRLDQFLGYPISR